MPHDADVAGALAALAWRPTDPQTVTDAIRAIWRERGARVGNAYDVTPCPYSTEDLAALHDRDRRPAYLPAELATQRTRHVLGQIFPLLRSYALFEHNPVTNLDNPSGWFDYDAAQNAPYTGTDEVSLTNAVSGDGRWLASLNQYIVASQDSKLVTGRYLDERKTWSRLAHYVDGRMVASRIDGAEPPEGPREEVPNEGCLLVAYDVGPTDRVDLLGGRSVGVPPAGQRNLVVDDGDPAALSPESIDDRPDPAALDLDDEWARQAAGFVRLGFATALDLGEDAYVGSLPRFAPQPPQYRGRLDVPLLMETRISWEQQADLAGISRSYSSRSHAYEPIDDRHAVPDQPYAAWCNWFGQRFVEPIAPNDARAQLADDELGGNLLELVALQIAHPILNATGRFIDAIGFESPTMRYSTATSRGRRNPGMCYWRARPEIGANMHPVAFSNFRPLVRGTAITTAPAAAGAQAPA